MGREQKGNRRSIPLWWNGRRKDYVEASSLVFPFVAVSIVCVTLLLGFVGYWQTSVRSGGERVVDSIVSSMALFAFSYTPPGNGATPAMLQAARLMAAVVASVGVLAAAAALLRERRDRLRSRRARGHVLVVGPGDVASELAANLRQVEFASGGRSSMVVNVDTASTHHARARGGVTTVLTSRHDELVHHAANASEVIILGDDPSQLLSLLDATVQAQNVVDLRRTIRLAVDDQRLVSELFGIELGDSLSHVETFSPRLRIIDDFIRSARSDRGVEEIGLIVIVGSGSDAEDVAALVLDGFGIIDGPPVSVFGPDANVVVDRLRRRGHRGSLTFEVPRDEVTDLPRTIVAAQRTGARPGRLRTVVIVTGETDAERVVRASRIARALRSEAAGLDEVKFDVACVLTSSGSLDAVIPSDVRVLAERDHLTRPDFIRRSVGTDLADAVARQASGVVFEYRAEIGASVAVGSEPAALGGTEISLPDLRRVLNRLGYQFAAGHPPLMLTPGELRAVGEELFDLPSDDHGWDDCDALPLLMAVAALPIALARSGIGLVPTAREGNRPHLSLEVLDQLAAAGHADYLATMEGRRADGVDAAGVDRDWMAATPVQQSSSRAQAWYSMAYLALLGIDVAPGTDLETSRVLLGERLGGGNRMPSASDLRAPLVDRLAEAEHDRWCIEKLSSGFVYGIPTFDPSTSSFDETNEYGRVHPCLVSWSDLDEVAARVAAQFGGAPKVRAAAEARWFGTSEKDRNAVRRIHRRLNHAGLSLAPMTGFGPLHSRPEASQWPLRHGISRQAEVS